MVHHAARHRGGGGGERRRRREGTRARQHRGAQVASLHRQGPHTGRGASTQRR